MDYCIRQYNSMGSYRGRQDWQVYYVLLLTRMWMWGAGPTYKDTAEFSDRGDVYSGFRLLCYEYCRAVVCLALVAFQIPYVYDYILHYAGDRQKSS
jgi:hypothetical protein